MITNFNKSYQNLSEILFGNLDELTSKDFIHKVQEPPNFYQRHYRFTRAPLSRLSDAKYLFKWTS